MINVHQINTLLSDVKFDNYVFRVTGNFTRGTLTYLQATFWTTDIKDGSIQKQTSRKWLLSPHMMPSEVVQTALKCALTAVEHEARERFTYKGLAIFGPHFDIETLVAACRADAMDARS